MTNKSKYTKTNGGGGNKNFNPIKSVKAQGFKPLIATSLALALSASVASADCTTLSNTTTPIFCYGTNGSVSGNGGALTDFTLTDNLSWNGTNGGTDSIYTLKTNSGTGDPVDITLKFDNTTTTPSASLVNGNYTITFNGTSTANDPVLALQSARGIDMQNKTLTFNFGAPSGSSWGSSTHERKMKLDLSQVTSGTAFRGNITIVGGRAQSWYGENHFVANFGSDMEGNITLTKTGGSTDIRSEFTFGGNLMGNITIGIGSGVSTNAPSGLQAGNTFTFTRGNSKIGSAETPSTITITGGKTTIAGLTALYGNIYRYDSASDTSTTDGTIIFSTKTQFHGNISRTATLSRDWMHDLYVEFQAGSTMEGTIQTGVGPSNVNHGGNDWTANYVTFSGATNTDEFVLVGDIISYGTGQASGTTGQALRTENGNHVTFTNGSMKGDITAGGIYNRSGYNQVTFSQRDAKLQGNALAKRNDGYDQGGTNKITFSNGGVIEGSVNATDYGTNNVIFGDTSASLTNYASQITGSVSAQGGSNRVEAINMSLTLNSISASGGSNTIQGNGSSNSITGGITSSRGSNTITFSGVSSTNSITGGIASTGGNNTIAFSGASSTNSIDGGVSTANGGINTITTSSSLVINGNITGNSTGSNNNANNISAGSLTLDSSQITAGTSANGWGVKNRFDISGNTTFSNTSLVIKADSTANAGGVKHNIFKFSGNVASSGIAEISTISRNNSGDNLKNTANILSFDGLTSNASLTIGKINNSATTAPATGYNYIGKGLTQGNNSTLELSFTENDWNTNTYQASNLSLTITENIYAKRGKNYINVGSLNVGGDIDGNAGTNNIATNSDFASRTIKARWGGSNNIFIGGTATITNISAGEEGGGTNTLTFLSTNSSSTITGNITANAGSNTLNFSGSNATFSMTEGSSTISIGGDGNNTLNIQEDTKVTSNLVASRTTGNGKNIFNISNTKSLIFADTNVPSTTKVLTTNSGVTEINFVGDSSGSTGNFSGNVSTSGGTTTFAFTNDNGTYGIVGNLSTSGVGQNIIDLSAKSATISNDLNFTGSEVSGEGGNIINIGASKTLALNNSGARIINTSGGATTLNFNGASAGLSGNVSTSGGIANINFKETDGTLTGNVTTSDTGTTNISVLEGQSGTISGAVTTSGTELNADIAGSAILALTSGLTTSDGVTTLNFNGASAGLSGNVSTSGGIANINFKETDGTLTGNVTTSDTGTTNITITNGKSGSISGTTTASGTAMRIDFLTGSDTTTLTLNSGNGTLSTTAGNTSINFNGSNGILDGLVDTNGASAITTITITDNSNGTINGAVTTNTTNGTTNVSFAGGTSAKSLTLGATGNNITNIILTGSSTANTLKLSTGTTGVSNNVEIADNQALTFSIGDSASLTLTDGLSNTGSTNVVFAGNDSNDGSGTFSGNITTGAESTPSLPAEEARNASLAKTTITFADSGTKASTATLLGILTAQNGGINEINIANDLELKVDSTNALKLTGNAQGNNNIILGSSATALSIKNSDASAVSHINTIGGNTNITLSRQDNFTLTSAGIGTYGTTAEGATTTINLNTGAEGINFKLFDNSTSTNGVIYSGGANETSLGKTIISFKDNATSILTADIQTDDYGVTTLNLGSTSANTTVAILDGTITNSGKMNFNINAKTTTLQTDGLAFSEGINNINFENTTGATLSWKDSDGTAFETISTTDSGTTNINFNNSGTIAGDSGTASIDTNGATASTTITLANLTQTPAEGAEGRVRNANGVSAVIQGAVTTTNGTTTIKFDSGNSAKTLTLGAGGNKLSTITLADGSSATTNNTLALSTGDTEIVNAVDIATAQALDFNLANGVNLTLTNGLTTNGGETTFNFNGENGTLTASQAISTTSGTTTFNLGSSSAESATITIDGQIGNTDDTQDASGGHNGGENFFSVNAKNVTLKSGDSGLAFSAGLNVIEFANTSGATLNWQSKSGASQAIQTTGGSTTIRFSKSGTIDGAISTIGGNTTFEIDNNAYAVVTGNVTTGAVSSGGSQVRGMTPRSGTASTDVNFKGNGALVLKGKNNHISNVILGSGTHILSLTDGINNGGAKERSERRNIVIDNIITGSGSLTLGTQTTTSQADTFIIKGASGDKQGTYHFGIIAEDGVKLDEIGTGESGAVRLASVADGAGISFESKSKVISGFTEATADITHATTDVDGNTGSGYTSYYIGKVSDAEVIAAEQEITATAFTLNYDLYMANLNSLNKRMGELRENAHSQGVWARVFNGALTNNFGLESKSNYTTIQAGYDYAFGFEGANNYLGVALSYALSTSTSQNAFDSEGQKRGIDNVYSNAVEVALYNSYVSDSGWYNDGIAKFSYIMSKFDISNLNTGSVTNNDTANFALTLGDEVGYVFKLGENKEWSITPQVEFTMGYFNQSDFKQTLANSTAYLASSADAVLTLRTRVGSAFAYDFKNFTQKDTFNASLYVGAFYEYDYVSGGGITLSTDQINGVENILSDLNSDGRVVMNVGTNMSIKDNTRLYFDFEKSFAGKITTDYQVNFGVRYSFGESNGYTPMIEKAEFKAPLKIEGEENKEEQGSEKAQESKEVEKTTEKTQDKSTKDKSQEKKAQ